VVAALAHAPRIYRFAATSADIVFITPQDEDSLRTILGELGEAQQAAGRTLKVYADLVVSLVTDPLTPGVLKSDARVFAGSATELADILQTWGDLGVDGVRLRPAVNGLDLTAIVDDVVPLLQRAGRFRTGYREGETLRERLGLPAAPNRYAAAART
jgi:alkanesulfonate monooxygenase SsuD/methylene tetrahydromethanopterin reductase-like flavin-dependent oxidoreductase (luciferase family)